LKPGVTTDREYGGHGRRQNDEGLGAAAPSPRCAC
jgi:hypothetical protein